MSFINKTLIYIDNSLIQIIYMRTLKLLRLFSAFSVYFKSRCCKFLSLLLGTHLCYPCPRNPRGFQSCSGERCCTAQCRSVLGAPFPKSPLLSTVLGIPRTVGTGKPYTHEISVLEILSLLLSYGLIHIICLFDTCLFKIKCFVSFYEWY